MMNIRDYAKITKNLIQGLPLYIGWDITYKCNLKCHTCKRWSIRHKELTHNEKFKIVDNIVKVKPYLLSINGGEPSLSDRFNSVLDYAILKKLTININTNGLIFDNYTIREFPYSFTIGLNDDVKLDGLKDIIPFFRNKSKIFLRISINQKNISKVEEIIDKWDKYVDGFMLQPIQECVNNYFIIPKGYDLENNKENRTLINRIVKTSKLRFKNYHKKLLINDKKQKCHSGKYFFQIDPFGVVYNCSEYKEKIGNALDNLNNLKRPKSYTCNCKYNCSGIINTYVK